MILSNTKKLVYEENKSFKQIFAKKQEILTNFIACTSQMEKAAFLPLFHLAFEIPFVAFIAFFC